MIDTIKLLIPINENREFLEKIKGKLTRTRREDLYSNKLEFEYFTADVPVGSYNRTIKIYIREGTPFEFYVEFSLPKYYLNNNVEMINAYDISYILKNFRNELSSYLETRLPPLTDWIIYRLDVCYNWTFKSKNRCQSLMNFIQRIDYPRKKKYIYETSVMYKGTAYTIKFYLKGPEFFKNDYKHVLNSNPNKALLLQSWADKVIRFEVEFKKKHFKKIFGKDIVKVSDICIDNVIEKLLQDYLASVFKYINKVIMKDEDIRQILNDNFTPSKALRLYNFNRGYYSNPDEKLLIQKAYNPSTIWRYKTDLKRVGIGFEDTNDNHLQVSVKDLIIPSENANFGILDYKSNADYI